MKIFSDIWSLLMALRLVDIIFFFSVLILMVLVVTLIYFIKINNVEEQKKDLEETQEMKIAKELRDSMKNNDATIKFTDYEKDQEDKAIISYDELIRNKDKININYDDEYSNPIPELEVRKISFSEDKNENTLEMPKLNVKMFEYEEEENFLKALKELQKDLSH